MIEKIKAVAIEEVLNQTFATTQQYLARHQVELEAGKPKVESVIFLTDCKSVVFFTIQNERFFLAVYLEDLQVQWVSIEDHHQVYFRATSEHLSFTELQAMTTLIASRGWSKGDQRRNSQTYYSFSALHLEPNIERMLPFDRQLRNLLDTLEQDIEGIFALGNQADTSINVCAYGYVGNGAIGGYHLDRETMKRIVNLGLSIDFDLYVSGEWL